MKSDEWGEEHGLFKKKGSIGSDLAERLFLRNLNRSNGNRRATLTQLV